MPINPATTSFFSYERQPLHKGLTDFTITKFWVDEEIIQP